MRISNLPGLLWVFLLIALVFTPITLLSQEASISMATILHAITEEIPERLPEKVDLASNASYRVQLGLFRDKQNVEKMIQKIENQYDLPLYIFIEVQKNTSFYRVLVGDFSSKNNAKDFIPQLKQNGLKGIVKKYDRWEDVM